MNLAKSTGTLSRMANIPARAGSLERRKPLPGMAQRGSTSQGDRDLWRLQQRYEDYLRSTVDWVWEFNADLVLTYVSPPVALTLGIPAQLLRGRPLRDLGRFEDREDGISAAEAAIAERQPFRDARFVIRSGDSEVAYRLSGVPSFDETSGHFTGYRGTAILDKADSTQAEPPEVERKLVETLEAVLARNIELETERAAAQGSESFGEGYLARLAHELRTPLNAIVGYAQLATRQAAEALPKPIVGYLDNIVTASRHLETLLADLDRSNREDPGERLRQDVVDISDVLQEAKRIVVIKAGEAGVDLSRVGPIPPWRVRGDRRACIQILVNLLGNAVKYTPEGGAVGAEAVPVDEEILEIKVWDTGIGIPESEQHRIFQSEYRADHGEIGHQSSGRGLGLAIVRDLARAMKGDIRLESMAGTGSCFILRLPLDRDGDSVGPDG